MKNNKKIHRTQQKHAIVELTATLLLLGLTVIAFVSITYFFLSTPQTSPGPITTITGKLVYNNLVLDHMGGEPISLAATIGLTFGSANVQFQAYDYVNAQAKEDGLWGFGEQVIYPMYVHPEYVEVSQIDVMIINSEPASSIMFCSVLTDPLSDLSVELTIDPEIPRVNQQVKFIITLRNNGNINVSDTKLRFCLPDGFAFIGYSATSGTYDNSTGVWASIATIQPSGTAILNVTAIVGRAEPEELTQLVILFDGSASLQPNDLKKIRSALVSTVANESVFPRNGAVEFSIIVFGSSSGRTFAWVLLSPTVVTNETIDTVLATLNTMDRNPGSAATSCGFLCAADTVYASSIFSPENRQVVLLMTDGKAATICNNDGDYLSDSPEGKDVWNSTKMARDYLINLFQMDEMQDELDVITIKMSDDEQERVLWFKNVLVYPQPGYYAPPFWTELPLRGFVANASNLDECSFLFNSIFYNLLNKITITADIIQASVTDPKVVNNIDGVVIML